MKTDKIEIKVYNQTMQIARCYENGFRHRNLFPYILEGDYVYGSKSEQLVQVELATMRTEDDVFVDIGASCGAFSVFMRPFCKQVIAFEPAPGIYDILAHNLKHDGERTQCHNVALLNEEKPSTAYMKKWGSFDLNLYGSKEKDKPPTGLVPVPLQRFDDYKIVPNLVKIDVEGCAGSVLMGGLESFIHSRAIFIEIHSDAEGKECLAILVSHLGCTARRISHNYIVGWQ